MGSLRFTMCFDHFLVSQLDLVKIIYNFTGGIEFES